MKRKMSFDRKHVECYWEEIEVRCFNTGVIIAYAQFELYKYDGWWNMDVSVSHDRDLYETRLRYRLGKFSEHVYALGQAKIVVCHAIRKGWM